MQNTSPPRREKGKSIIAFPPRCTVIDIETSGHSPDRDEIIELSALRVEDGRETARFTTLIKPASPVSPFITGLTGITNAMLADAPVIGDRIGEFADFLGDSVLVGYNVSFDVNFIHANMLRCLGRPLSNDYVDVLRIARVLLPDLPRHRQVDVAEYFRIPVDVAHRSLADCETCRRCYAALAERIIAEGTSLEAFCRSFRRCQRNVNQKRHQPTAE